MKLKITVQPDSLQQAMHRVGGIPSEKSPLDTHHNISLVAPEGRQDVRVFASNPIFCASAVVAGAVREGHGHITLPADRFKNLVGNLTHTASFMLSDDDKTSMKSPGWSCKLPTIITSLSTPKMIAPLFDLTLRVEPLLSAIDTAVAISERGAFRGIETDVVVLHLKNHAKPMVLASDSKQGIIIELPATSSEEVAGKVLKVPERAAKSLLSFFKGDEGLVRLRYSDNVLSIWNPDGNIAFINLLAGPVLPVLFVKERLVTLPVTKVMVPKASLVQAVRRASLVTKGDFSKSVCLRVEEGVLHVECEMAESGESTAEVEEATIDGEDVRIWINYEELLIVLAKLQAEAVQVSIGADDTAIYIDCPPAWWSIAATVKSEGESSHGTSNATAKESTTEVSPPGAPAA